tara:strand:+ start:581 stop:1426 length:846 start_codon:yes stop_codon:yes gene_type:complete
LNFKTNRTLYGDCRETLKELPEQSINTCITSPPYWGLRNYQEEEQLGLEDTPEEFVENLVKVFREVKRVLRDDGTVWLNLGDSYYNYRPGKGQSLIKQTVSNTNQDLPQEVARRANKIDGLKEKDLVGIPWRVAFALQADGWYLRQDIIWNKPNPMPESVQDRCTKAHEYIFLLSKNPKYYFDNEAIKEDAESEKKNKRSVWTVTTKPFKGAHFAVFPPDLIEPCILAGCPKDGVVLDPFMGSGTTGMVAQQLGRKWIGCELNAEYISMQKNRTAQQVLEL